MYRHWIFLRRFGRFASACLGFAIFLFFYGLMNQLDYEEARLRECAVQGLAYNPFHDTCYGPPKKN